MRLSAADAEQIAIALGDVLKTRMLSDWVQIIKEPEAGEYSIVVVTEDVMARVRPFEDTLAWASITEPAMIGYQIDGRPYHLLLRQHGQNIGQTRSGKSSAIHTKIAHVTRCGDAVQWLCGSEKVYDLAAGWVEPYMDTGLPLPIDWVASGPRDSLDMLIAGMNIARWRQRQPLSKRGGWPDIIITLDEASFLLRNRAVRGTYQGQEVTASQMAAMLRQGGGSAGVWLDLATQRSTNDHGGDQGGDIGMNAGYCLAFRSKDQGEIGRLMGLGHYKLPTPRHQGVCWLDAGNGDDPIQIKVPYIQESDPSKPKLHTGLTVSDVAWSRRQFITELDAGSAGAGGEAYARRHTRMDAAMLAYLTDADVVEAQAPSSANQAGYALAMQELATLGIPLAASSRQSVAARPTEVTALAGRKPRAERVVDILRTSAPEPMAPTDVLNALHESGDTAAQEQVVLNILSKLVTRGAAERPARGLYAHSPTTESDITSNLTS